MIVIGNKADLDENREVDKTTADKWAVKEKGDFNFVFFSINILQVTLGRSQ